MADLVVAGAGMAGLAAAARARELGADVVVYEKGDRPGGSMLLSSGVIWRYREWETFRAECPGGDPALQRVVWEGLDDALAWLESLGAPVVARETGNPLTTGVRFDPRGLTRRLRRTSASASSCSSPRRHRDDPRHRRLPGRPPSSFAATSRPSHSCSGPTRGAPATVCEWLWIEAVRFPREWTSSTAGTWPRPRGSTRGTSCGWRRSTRGTRPSKTGGRTLRGPALGRRRRRPVDGPTAGRPRLVRGGGRRAGRAGARTDRPGGDRRGPRGRRAGRAHRRRHARSGSGCDHDDSRRDRVDERARAADGLWAAGADVGGVSTGGWSSALASALVLGRTAAEDALG